MNAGGGAGAPVNQQPLQVVTTNLVITGDTLLTQGELGAANDRIVALYDQLIGEQGGNTSFDSQCINVFFPIGKACLI